MKKITYICISFFVLTLISCEDVINLDLKTSKERLVIEALMKWEKGTIGNEQVVKLSKTASYYQNQSIPATNALVSITHQNGTSYVFTETTNGIYTTNSFQPEIGISYTLEISYEGGIYTATEKMVSVPEIDKITQVDRPMGESSIIPNVEVFFTDEASIDNFYKITYRRSRDNKITNQELYLYDDRFEDGEQLSILYEDYRLFPNDVIEISLLGLSERFYNYIDLLDDQSNSEGFGPFSIPPVNVKGNCINTINSDNYPYGYFGLSEIAKETYVFQ